MQCVHPYRIKNPNLLKNGDMREWIDVPCGHCVACRLARSREWAVRLLHESEFWDDAVFVTLTYDDEHLQSPSLVPRDLQLFFKRLRKDLKERKIKFFACGEYGDRFARPHYHAIIFGLSAMDNKLIEDNWSLGFVKVGTMTYESCRYVAGYVQKKLYGDGAKFYEDNHLVPPFLRCSKGLGERYVDKYNNKLYSNLDITVHGHSVGIPRYYRKKMDMDSWLLYNSEREEKVKKRFINECGSIVDDLIAESSNYCQLDDNAVTSIVQGVYDSWMCDRRSTKESLLKAKLEKFGGRDKL